jgi:hypothetical protein
MTKLTTNSNKSCKNNLINKMNNNKNSKIKVLNKWNVNSVQSFYNNLSIKLIFKLINLKLIIFNRVKKLLTKIMK